MRERMHLVARNALWPGRGVVQITFRGTGGGTSWWVKGQVITLPNAILHYALVFCFIFLSGHVRGGRFTALLISEARCIGGQYMT